MKNVSLPLLLVGSFFVILPLCFWYFTNPCLGSASFRFESILPGYFSYASSYSLVAFLLPFVGEVCLAVALSTYVFAKAKQAPVLKAFLSFVVFFPFLLAVSYFLWSYLMLLSACF